MHRTINDSTSRQRSSERGGGGGGGVLCLKWKATLSFPTVSFLYGA